MSELDSDSKESNAVDSRQKISEQVEQVNDYVEEHKNRGSRWCYFKAKRLLIDAIRASEREKIELPKWETVDGDFFINKQIRQIDYSAVNVLVDAEDPLRYYFDELGVLARGLNVDLPEEEMMADYRKLVALSAINKVLEVAQKGDIDVTKTKNREVSYAWAERMVRNYENDYGEKLPQLDRLREVIYGETGEDEGYWETVAKVWLNHASFHATEGRLNKVKWTVRRAEKVAEAKGIDMRDLGVDDWDSTREELYMTTAQTAYRNGKEETAERAAKNAGIELEKMTT